MILPPCNFRQILPDSIANKSLKLYRSNTLDDGETESVQWLRETMGINCYIDLRGTSGFSPKSKLDKYYLFKQKRDIKITETPNDFTVKGHRYNFDFFSWNFLFKKIILKLNLFQILKLIFLFIQHLLFNDFQYFSYLTKYYLCQITLGDVYCSLLDTNLDLFKFIFLLMKNKSNYPMLISCNYGKDRTGITSALIMQLAGCSDKLIIQEYSKSQVLLETFKEKINAEARYYNVNEEFAQCPPGAMTMFLKYLKTKYGGAGGYLKLCGISNEEIEQIRHNLIEYD